MFFRRRRKRGIRSAARQPLPEKAPLAMRAYPISPSTPSPSCRSETNQEVNREVNREQERNTVKGKSLMKIRKYPGPPPYRHRRRPPRRRLASIPLLPDCLKAALAKAPACCPRALFISRNTLRSAAARPPGPFGSFPAGSVCGGRSRAKTPVPEKKTGCALLVRRCAPKRQARAPCRSSVGLKPPLFAPWSGRGIPSRAPSSRRQAR